MAFLLVGIQLLNGSMIFRILRLLKMMCKVLLILKLLSHLYLA